MDLDDWDSSRVVDSFATGSGKYEDARSECLDEEEMERDTHMDDYLLNMSPIGSSRRRKKGRKDLQKGTLSVKCSNSRENITGTPSELALKLSREMESYLPHRRRIFERGINDQVAEFFEDNVEFEPENVCEIDYERSECPGAFDEVDEHDHFDDEYRCPGTMNILSGRMVPCSVAPTLREIALGRRMRKTVIDAPECSSDEDSKSSGKSSRKRDKCICKKDNIPATKAETSPNKCHTKIESCCTRKKRNAKQGRCVTFDT